MLIAIIIIATLVLTAGIYFVYTKKPKTNPPVAIIDIKYPYKIKVAKLLDKSDENSKKEYAGQIIIDERHNLSFSAEAKYQEILQEAIDEINARSSLNIESGPPPGGDNRRGSWSRIIEKNDNDWALAVEENLEKNYQLIKIQ